jgi:hypothetical protein
MVETADSEMLKPIPDLTHILRSGMMMVEQRSKKIAPLPQVAETNTPRSMDVPGGCLSYDVSKE